MEELNIGIKQNGDPLDAQEWNQITNKIDELVNAVNESSSDGTPIGIDTNGVVSVNSKGNTTISSTKHVNIEPVYDITGGDNGIYGDVQIKPGDDITLESHHRATKKRDEITVKTSNGLSGDNNAPVKLQIISSDITLSSKGKRASNNDSSNVTNVNITTGTGKKGYLKIRAQAIDLRCEEHGGIAIQPKGTDNSGNMNKIKFEHGGGDGLEFGTFNTEKTSIYTDEYRFKKDGIWKMATREKLDNTKDLPGEAGVTVGNGKYNPLTDDETKHYSYKKQVDDFYDVINSNDETATTKSIIKTAHALNDGKNRHVKYEEKYSSKGDLKKTLEIQTNSSITFQASEEGTPKIILDLDPTKEYTISDFKDLVKAVETNEPNVYNKYGIAGEDGVTLSDGDIISVNETNYTIILNFSPSININSEEDLSIKAKEGTLSLGGNIVEFGSDTIDLGEMEDGLYALYKLTKKSNSKPCDTLKIKVINNQASPLEFNADSGNFAILSFYPTESITIPAKVSEPTTDIEANQHIVTVAQCKLYDVIKFVAWAKNNNFGPWAN